MITVLVKSLLLNQLVYWLGKTKIMTKSEKSVFEALIEQATDAMGNNGCNDFKLSDYMPKKSDRQALIKKMHEDNGDPENFDPTNDYEYFEDYWLLSYLSEKLLLND
jgi:hypothetical protein